MRCPRCDANIKDTAKICSFCGQELSLIHYVRRISNTYYNLGLEKAQVRDLSGAITMLKKSLQYDKMNSDARNLLGLIYYEMGETVVALSEWVLSKYLQPEDNVADYYINTVQKNQTALDATNQTIKKYNSALAAAQAGNEDLAIIQLKKVVSLNPHFVRAQQLLALLYIQAEEYSRAAKCLNRARRIDFNNTTTLRYMQEVGDKVGNMGGKVTDVTNPKKTPKKDPLANVTPIGTYKEEKRSLLPVMYVIIGAIVGIAISLVLIRPTLQKASGDSGSQISNTNDQLAVQSSQISSLQKEKDVLEKEKKELEKTIEDADTASQKQLALYEKLLKGTQYYLAGDKIQAAIEVVGCKKKDFTLAEAKTLYTMIATVTDSQIATLVSQGKSKMYQSYEEAIAIFKKVAKLDKDNQESMYYIGYCYMRKNDTKNAKKWFDKCLKVSDTGSFAIKATNYLSQLGDSEEEPTEPPQ